MSPELILLAQLGAGSTEGARITARQLVDAPKSYVGRPIVVPGIGCVNDPKGGFVCVAVVAGRGLRIEASLLGAKTAQSIAEQLIGECKGTANLSARRAAGGHGRPARSNPSRAAGEWQVLIKDRLPAYIDWDRYEENLAQYQAGGCGRLHDRLLAGPAGVARPADHQDPNLRRHHVEQLRVLMPPPMRWPKGQLRLRSSASQIRATHCSARNWRSSR